MHCIMDASIPIFRKNRSNTFFSFLPFLPLVNENLNTTPTPSLKISFHLFVALNKTPYNPTEDDINGLLSTAQQLGLIFAGFNSTNRQD